MALSRAMRSEMSLKRSQPTQFAQACHVGFLTRGAQLGETKVETKNVIFYRSIATLAKKVRFVSPTTARVLDGVADSYEREAGRWDELERWDD